MTRKSDNIPVLAVPHWDPEASRIELNLPHGLTVDEIVRHALPGADPQMLKQTRVALVSEKDSEVILPDVWKQVRPRPGVRVVIRVISGKGALKSILSIVIAVAAVAIGAYFAVPLAGTLGLSATTWGAVVAAGVSIVGNLLLNALIPPVKPDNEKKASYQISGWKNKLDPDGAVPFVLGKMRFAPPFAARPYTDIVGDKVFINAVFLLGEGRLAIDDMRIGETSLSEFDEVETEVRYGIEGEEPIAQFPRQVVEEQIGVDLVRPLPRDDAGEIIKVESESDWPVFDLGLWPGFSDLFKQGDNAPGIETPVVRTTGPDASGASVILAWPGGLVRYNEDGEKRNRTVRIRIEHRLVEAEEWQEVETLEVTAKKAETFYRQYTWDFPIRARWQVRLTMLTDESDDSKIQQRTSWAALQTLRPEYPLNFHRPLALVAVRVKATYQLNGALDNFNCMVSRLCRDWDEESQTWVERETENAASAYREVLQHAANPKFVADDGLDLDLITEFHEFCTAKGLTYNRVLEDTGTTLREVLTEIAAAGRATPRHDGVKWGVVIDRPSRSDLIIDHINPVNSWAFKWSRTYISPPHALVVTFPDAGNDYNQAQRIVRWPGYEGDITLTEKLELPGKVYADEVWREVRRRQLETIYRPDSYQATQEGAVRVATRGDAIMLSHDVLSRVQQAARVRRLMGNMIELSTAVTMEEGTDYAIRFRVYENNEDTVGMSITRRVTTSAGDTTLVIVQGSGALPEYDDIVHFGPVDRESFHQIVRSVEITEDQCSIIRTVDAAPEIDEELEMTEVPAWSSRVGFEIGENALQPSAPRFTSVSSGLSGTDDANLISYLIEPGSGAVITTEFQIEYRLQGETAWAVETIPAANGGGDISAYANGDIIEMRARGISSAGIFGPYTSVIVLIVGTGDAEIPDGLDDDTISITTLLGGALIQFATGADAATTQIQLYRSTSAVLDRETDAVGAPMTVTTQQSYSTTIGDTTRQNLVTSGAMENATDWILEGGWSIAGGKAVHAAGTADTLSQGLSIDAGKFYRLSFSISAISAGSVAPKLSGGSDRPGTARSAAGVFSDRIQAVTGNDTIGFLSSSDFEGEIDDVVAYLETESSLSQGTHYVWLEPQNESGVAGVVSGPFVVEIT